MGDLLKGDILVKKKLAVIVSAALLLVGCSSITSGVIVKKNHYDAYDYPVQYCAMYDTKTFACRMWMTRIDHVNEHWSFDIRDGKNTGWVDVSSSEFNQYKLGDYYGEKR
jgi:uncharacterized protein YceK